MSFGHVCLCMLAFKRFKRLCDIVNCQKKKFKTDRVTSAAETHTRFFDPDPVTQSIMSDFSLFL